MDEKKAIKPLTVLRYITYKTDCRNKSVDFVQNYLKLLQLSSGDDTIVLDDVPESKHWITTREDNRVLIGNDGTIYAGFGGKFNGQNIGQIGKNNPNNPQVGSNANSNGSNSQRIKNISDQAMQKYALTTCNLGNMDSDVAQRCFNEIDNILQEYPELDGKLTEIHCIDALPDGSTDFVQAMQPIDGHLYINSKYFNEGNTQALNDMINTCVEYGHFPPNTSIESVIAHEMGHLAEGNICNQRTRSRNAAITASNKGTYSARILDESLSNISDSDFIRGARQQFNFGDSITDEVIINNRNAGIRGVFTDSDIRKIGQRSISGYATTNTKETLAEAFGDVRANGSSASSLSLAMIQTYKNRYRR